MAFFLTQDKQKWPKMLVLELFQTQDEHFVFSSMCAISVLYRRDDDGNHPNGDKELEAGTDQKADE